MESYNEEGRLIMQKIGLAIVLILLFLCKHTEANVLDSTLEKKHHILLSKLSGVQKDKYMNTHVVFLQYLNAEERNLSIFRKTSDKKIKHEAKESVYETTLDFIKKYRIIELDSLINNNNKWFSIKTRENLYTIFDAMNKRVPYDRGEKLRYSFRKVDSAWKEFVAAEKEFYASLQYINTNASIRCEQVLYELRVENLLSEHKEVLAIKKEKEE